MLNKKLWEDVNTKISPEPEDPKFSKNFSLIPVFERYSNEKLEEEYQKRLLEVIRDDPQKQFTDQTLLFLIREMKKRFRAGLVNFSNPQQESNDILFKKALPVFRKHFLIQFIKRDKELTKIRNEGIRKNYNQINIIISLRYQFHRDLAEAIGEEFLASFDELIHPFCAHISNASLGELYTILNSIFSGMIKNAEQEFGEFIASKGMDRTQLKSFILPARGIFTSALSTYRDQLDVKVMKHNLEVNTKEEAPKEIIKYIPTETSSKPIETIPKKTNKKEVQIKTRKRKRRTKIELEVLTPKVEQAYLDLYGDGKYTWNQIFERLSRNSMKLFGGKLTSGSLQGIYNRRHKYLK